MIQLLNQRKEAAGLDNLNIRKVEEDLPLDDKSCDLILMVTVFQGHETPMGPPLPHWIAKEEVQDHAEANGFHLVESFANSISRSDNWRVYAAKAS